MCLLAHALDGFSVREYNLNLSRLSHGIAFAEFLVDLS